MAKVDDSREEHRMLVRLDDTHPLLARLIIGEEYGKIKNNQGMLRQKVHDKPYTITLYVLPKDYGMFAVNRIKPRVRFSKSPYDEKGAGSTVILENNATVDFAEFKYKDEDAKPAEPELLRKIFSDGPTIKDIKDDPVRLLVAQHDTFLMQPPVKSKSKVTSFEQGKGIPVAEFLEALNNPKKTEAIFKKYKGGEQFAKDLSEALEPFKGLEFEFGIYSRYQRWDCIYSDDKGLTSEGYRTTFDPSTVLGWIKHENDRHLLEPLINERMARWENKVNPSSLTPKVLRRIMDEIGTAREKFLIPRCLSKSQTALNILGESKEAQLCLIDELSYELKIKTEISGNKFSDMNERRRLRNALVGSSQYSLAESSIVEKHQNLAIGTENKEQGKLEYVLNNALFTVKQRAQEKDKGDFRIITRAKRKFPQQPIRSAKDLRAQIYSSIGSKSFDDVFSLDIHECGFIIENKESGRHYTVSLGKRQKGSVSYHQISRDKPENYISIKYLGITPKAHSGIYAPEIKQKEVLKEMKTILAHLQHKGIA